jgi:hypothetical protein
MIVTFTYHDTTFNGFTDGGDIYFLIEVNPRFYKVREYTKKTDIIKMTSCLSRTKIKI